KGGSDKVTVDASALTGGSFVMGDTGTGVGDVDQLTVLGTSSADAIQITATRVRVNSITVSYSAYEVLRIGGREGDDTIGVFDSSAATLYADGAAGSDTYQVFDGLTTIDVRISDSGPLPDLNSDTLETPVVSNSHVATVGGKTVNYDETIEKPTITPPVSPIVSLSIPPFSDVHLQSTILLVNGTVLDLTGRQELTLDGGTGGNINFFIDSIPPDLQKLTLIGGSAGGNRIVGPEMANTWE